MNTAFGDPKAHELPFDLRYARWPIQFELADDASGDARRAARDGLIRDLKGALTAVFGDPKLKASLRADAPAESHPHDVELLQRFHRQIPLALKKFLRQHNFGNSFLLGKLDPLHEMNEDWVGADYEFHDAVVQAAFVDVRQAAHAFGELVVQRIYAMRGNPKMGWPKTDQDAEIGIQPNTEQAIRDLNAKATALSKMIDTLERVARERIRVAGGAHAAAAQAEADQVAAEEVRRNAAETALNELAMDANRGALPEIVTRPRLTLRLAPVAATQGNRLDPRHVADVQLRFPPNGHARVKNDSDARQWWSCVMPRKPEPHLNPETTWRMRLVRPGYLEYQATIGARIDDDPQILIDGRRLEALIVRTLERMGQIASALDLDGPALAIVALDGMEDVELTRAQPGGRRVRQPDVFLPIVKLAGMEAPMAPAVHEALDMLWQSAGWPDGSPSFSAGAWAGYVDERNYEPSVFGA
ncbi:MAG: hypothetical protein WDN46_04505 [Methylocella sp.]